MTANQILLNGITTQKKIHVRILCMESASRQATRLTPSKNVRTPVRALEKDHKLLSRNRGHVLLRQALLNGHLLLSDVLPKQVLLGPVHPSGILQGHVLLGQVLLSGLVLSDVLLGRIRTQNTVVGQRNMIQLKKAGRVKRESHLDVNYLQKAVLVQQDHEEEAVMKTPRSGFIIQAFILAAKLYQGDVQR